MHRRRFNAALALAAGMAPLAGRAQTAGKPARLGVLSGAARPTESELQKNPFNVEMRRLGWVEGQNLVVARRYAEGKLDRMPAFAQELVDAKVDVIVALGHVDAEHARRLTSTLPIVTIYGGMDPVADGLIASFARPGGNVTGVSRMLGETRAKRLELIKTLLPAAGRVAVLAPPLSTYPGEQAQFEAALRSAARALRVELDFHWFRNLDELMAAFPAMAAARTPAFLLEPTSQTWANRSRIADLAIQHRLPGVFTLREYAQAGGLMSYGPDISTVGRQLAQQVDRILRGAKPGDLPMEQPTRFDLVLNRRTAKAIGLVLPQSLLLRAEELID